MNAKVGDMELPTCVWFDDIESYKLYCLEQKFKANFTNSNKKPFEIFEGFFVLS